MGNAEMRERVETVRRAECTGSAEMRDGAKAVRGSSHNVKRRFVYTGRAQIGIEKHDKGRYNEKSYAERGGKPLYRILIIEDDMEINKLLAGFLADNGYETVSLYDGLHVPECLQEKEIDLILLDIMLPYRSGDVVLAEIRRQFAVPVIILSAKETTQNKIDLLRLGADDYITKPFDMEEVLARIESNLRRVQLQKQPQSCFQYQELTLDADRNVAELKGRELSLTAKEFAVLELLMKYPDKIFSKANLFQSVWHTEYISEDNTLNVHISNLRNKLKAVCPEQEFIDTVWGIGYRLHKAKG